MILPGYVLSLLYAPLCLLLAAFAAKRGMPRPYTRKLVHILVGAEWFILYYTVGVSVHFLVVCLIFLLLLYVSYRKNLTPSISSDDDNAPGTVYYALSMSILAALCLFLPAMMLPFGVAVCCTSLGDGFAGVCGQLWGKYTPTIFGRKTLLGTLANFVFSTLGALLIRGVCDIPLSIGACFAVGAFSAGAELLAGAGLDNVAVPLATAILTYALTAYPGIRGYLLPILLTPYLVAFALQKRALTTGGVIAALAVDLIFSVFLGNFGFFVLLFFFVGGVVTDRVKKAEKERILASIEQKGSCRDAAQVFANAGLPALLAVLFAATGNPSFRLAFVCAMAEALGDTAASGIGVLSSRTFDLFHFRPCPRGISGGMSVLGVAAALVGSLLVPLVSLPWIPMSAGAFFAVWLAAFAGTVFDSFLGSLVQLKYRCPLCGKVTERRTHCGAPTERVGGYVPFDNDFVNFSSGLFAAGVCLLLTL